MVFLPSSPGTSGRLHIRHLQDSSSSAASALFQPPSAPPVTGQPRPVSASTPRLRLPRSPRRCLHLHRLYLEASFQRVLFWRAHPVALGPSRSSPIPYL